MSDYAAATAKSNSSAEIVFFPYDLRYVDSVNGADKAGPIASHILRDVLMVFGHDEMLGLPEAVDDLRAEQLTSGNPTGETTMVQLTWPRWVPSPRPGFIARDSETIPSLTTGPEAAQDSTERLEETNI